MIITLEDLAERMDLVNLDIREIELVGEVHSFGQIVINRGQKRLGIFIFDENKILDVFEEFMKFNIVRRQKIELEMNLMKAEESLQEFARQNEGIRKVIIKPVVVPPIPSASGRTHIRKQLGPTGELAELRATRERLQREKPTPEQLLAESEHPDFVPLWQLLFLHELGGEFRRQREHQGLSLAEVSSRTGIDQSTLSRLETGKAGNPGLATLQRVAAALGKRVRCHLEDASPLAGAGV